MEELIRKVATISVDYLSEEGLFLGDTVEILEEREEEYFLGKRVAIKVRSLERPKTEKWIFRSEVIFLRKK